MLLTQAATRFAAQTGLTGHVFTKKVSRNRENELVDSFLQTAMATLSSINCHSQERPTVNFYKQNIYTAKRTRITAHREHLVSVSYPHEAAVTLPIKHIRKKRYSRKTWRQNYPRTSQHV